MKGIVWFLSLIWWQILLGIFFSTLAYEKNHLMNVRGSMDDCWNEWMHAGVFYFRWWL
jgi:hypothetical protein